MILDSVSPGTGLNRRAGGAKSGRRCLSVFTLPHFFPVRYARVAYVVVGSVGERKAVCDAARPSAERDTVRAHAVVIVSVATRDGIHRNSASIRPMEAVAERRFTRNEFYLRQIVSMQRNVQIICVGSLFGVSRRRIVQSVVEHRLRNALCTDVVARRRHHCARICGRTVRVLLTGAIRYRVEDSFELALVVVLRAHEIVRVARPQRTDRTLNVDCGSRAGAGRFAVAVSTRVERRVSSLHSGVGCRVLGSKRPSARRDVRDDVHVWRHRSMIRPARILSTKLRDATRRARCDDGRIGARCAPSYAPSRRRSRGSRTHIIITALLQKCTSLRTVCPTLSHTIFYGYFRDSELSYSSLSYTRVREYDETRATAADARVDTMPTRT